MEKVESIKQIIEVMKDLDKVEKELNIKCKQSGEHIDFLNKLVTESNSNLSGIINNFA